jgi:DMSO/TMAO reductase YedYZ molybdopterin-dependent catalytic subunit
MPTLSRREFVSTSLSLPFLLPSRSAFTHEDDPRFPGLIVRSAEPRNLEFPFSFLKDKITPNEQFFVRSHFSVPSVEKEKWSLAVEGTVAKKLSLSYAELLKLPAVEVTSTLECAGNGRVFLKPGVPGLQWGHGAVSSAKWKGVRLSTILESVGLSKASKEILIEGSDKGAINNPPTTPGPIHFDRSIPLSKALQNETILAYAMNDAPLPEDHGGPVRLIVPGWYGMASVKWVKRLVALEKPYQGFWQTLDYSYWERRDGAASLVPLTSMQPKACIASPALNEVVPSGKKFTVRGAAWTGEAKIQKVEVSTDGGKTWALAKLKEEPQKYLWVFWEFDWQVPTEKGQMKLLARATDDTGATQPTDRDPDRRTYMINHLIPVEVIVG